MNANVKVTVETLLDQTGDKSSSSPCTLPLTPKLPSKCPLFCCFYSEFDIKKGPVISFQSPKGLMDQDINISTERIQELLAKTFQDVAERDDTTCILSSPNSTTLRSSTKDNNSLVHMASQSFETTTCTNEVSPGRTQLPNSTILEGDNASILTTSESIPTQPNPSTTNSTGNAANANPAGLSIFDSTSEYIITGSELTSKTITLSTHSFHVMTRPTMISNPRYERNALLFSVGFLLRRAADPSPFRPLLSKLAITLQAMEEESRFLTSSEQRPKLQTLLEQVLLSLNSSEWECNLLLSRSNALHLKLYHPPKPEAAPVHDHEVPILLRKDADLQMYDWDLAINWVILHIDGITNARQISVKAEVDLEMVQACLRVLKHHGVIALVSPFSYSNHYEFTPKATAMLAGKESKLLQEALQFVWKRRVNHLNPQTHVSTGQIAMTSNNNGLPASPGSESSSHPTNNPVIGSPYSYFGFTPSSSSYPPRTAGVSISQRSSRFAILAASHSLEKETPVTQLGQNSKGDEIQMVRSALAEFYCACSRNLSFGDLWVALTTVTPDAPPSGLIVPNHQQSKQQQPQRYGQYSLPPTSYSVRKGSISEEYPDEAPPQQFPSSVLENLALSPSESHNLESLRRSGKKSNDRTTPLNWNEFFTRIDHRRLVTFGLIHGIIVRIHCYPCFPFAFPDPSTTFSPLMASVEATAGSDGKTNDATAGSTANVTTSHASSRSRGEEYQLAKLAASLMDGTRCDDELACTLEIPFRRLVEMVEMYGKRKVICLYAARSE